MLWVLESGQVPTPEAVSKVIAEPPVPRSTAEGKAEALAETKRLAAVIRADRDSFGELLSEVIALHWARNKIGPTWHEAWQSEALTTWWALTNGRVPDYRLARGPLFSILERAGWIAFNRRPRSLCTGRRFHTRFHGDHVSHAPAPIIGYSVARHIGIHRRLHDRSPSWGELAESTTDDKGVPLFFNAGDGRAQQRWLETHEWIRIEGDELRRGERAKAETRRRAALKRAAAATEAA